MTSSFSLLTDLFSSIYSTSTSETLPQRAKPPPRTPEEQKARAIAIETRRMEETPQRLATNPRLWPHEPEKWIGIAILGQGSFGVASLWEFVGDGSPEDEINALMGKSVVIKTGLNHPATTALYEEGKIQKWLMERGDSHIAQLVYNFDEALFDKLYMEWCSRGDMASVLRNRGYNEDVYTEMELWKLFGCLARACKAMKKVDRRKSLLHMDMKPQNVLVQEANMENHECRGGFDQYKVSDFGLSYEQRFPSFSSMAWRPSAIGRGTTIYKAPEQWFRHLEFGEKINVWGVGTIMFQALLLSDRPPPGPRPVVKKVRQVFSFDKFKSPFGSEFIPALNKGYKYGQDLETAAEAQLYSVELRATILHCLMHDPKNRSSSDELVSRINKYIHENYTLTDPNYENKRYEDKKKEERIEELERRKVEKVKKQADVLAGMTKPQVEAEILRIEKEIREEMGLQKPMPSAREQKYRGKTPPLWVQKMLTDDQDTQYWINTQTGFPSWDDPFEDPPLSRTNTAGKVRDLLEHSPLEQQWVERYEDFQGNWRRVWTRNDTGQVSYTEPRICREWREWYRAYWRQCYLDPGIVLPDKPERQCPEIAGELGESGWFYKPWDFPWT